MMKYALVTALIMAFIPCISSASENDRHTQITTTKLNQYKKDAGVWHLSMEEWKRYKSIMDGVGKYRWKNQDPITVLGLNARNDEERKHYAEMMARNEHHFAEQLVSLNMAYMRAFQRQFGNEPVLDLNKMRNFIRENAIREGVSTASNSEYKTRQNNLMGVGDHYVVFLTKNCLDCNKFFKHVRAESESHIGTILDVYMVDGTKDSIFNWAKKMKIDPDMVNNGSVTLNIGDKEYQHYNRPPVPAAFYYNKKTGNIARFKPSDT